MRVLVMSDTHKDLSGARLAIGHALEQSLDIVIHCGDNMDDAKQLEKEYPKLKFYYVPGNCDGWFFKENERTKVIHIAGKKVLITHGDRHNVKNNYENLFKDVKLKNADIGLCGHTHVAYVEEAHTGIMVINPGSISLPRDSKYPSYAILEMEKDQPIKVKSVRLKHTKAV